MKKNYIIPNQKVALMDAESVLLQGSNEPKNIQIRSGAPAVENMNEVWAKENNSWDTEW